MESKTISAEPTSKESEDLKPVGSTEDTADSPSSPSAFKVTPSHHTWEVLPMICSKHGVKERWQDYVLLVAYGSPDDRLEYCMAFDEKPLLLFQTLQDTGKNPTFVLKGRKTIRPPVVVARQKIAALKAAHLSIPSTPSTSGPWSSGSGSERSSGASGNGDQVSSLAAAASALSLSSTLAGDASDSTVNTPTRSTTSKPHQLSEKQCTEPETIISYGVGIYPWMAEGDDGMDVDVGNSFIIVCRSYGWWKVQRDMAGSGKLIEGGKRGWIPSGCVLETSIPIHPGITKAHAARSAPAGPRTPIWHRNIVSKGYPAIALMNYEGDEEGEIHMTANEALVIYKKYKHWAYVVKDNGSRGWVPGWFLGKNPIEQET